MKQKPDYYEHPHSTSTDPIYGLLLEKGDVLKKTDFYASSNGKWEPCTCPGLTIKATHITAWVRPV